MSSHSVAFWSYAHDDDRAAAGGIVALARALADEYSLLTGRVLHLFVDRDLKWGEEWRRRIDDALVETTFLVPVLTPRYFTREECRRELLEFRSRATALGVTELIAPVLFAPVTGFSTDNRDEAISIASKMQYVDWTHLRLASADSADYKAAVNIMAQRLLDTEDEIRVRQERREVIAVTSGHDGREPDLAETVSAMENRLAEWSELLEREWIVLSQHVATDDEFLIQRMKAAARPGVRFAVHQRFAAEFLALQQRRLDITQKYSALTIDLDVYVRDALRVVADHPEERRTLASLDSALTKRRELITAAQERNQTEHSTLRFTEAAERYKHITRLWLEAGRLAASSNQYLNEANNLIEGWERGLESLAGEDTPALEGGE